MNITIVAVAVYLAMCISIAGSIVAVLLMPDPEDSKGEE